MAPDATGVADGPGPTDGGPRTQTVGEPRAPDGQRAPPGGQEPRPTDDGPQEKLGLVPDPPQIDLHDPVQRVL